MRAEQINNLRRGDSQALYEFVNKYKNDVLSLSIVLNVNKNNVDKLLTKDLEGFCTDSFINVLRDLKNAPSGPAFRKWLLKTVYKKAISDAIKLEPKKDTKIWKKFSVINREIDNDKLITKLSVLPVNQRLAIWASCQQNMNNADASIFFEINVDDYAILLNQGLQGLRNRFVSDSAKMPETINCENMIDIVYNFIEPSAKVDLEKELNAQKIRKKYYDLMVNERKIIGNSFNPMISGNEILTGIRSKFHLVKKHINPLFFVSFEIFILVIIGFIILYFSRIVKPPEILVNVENGSAKITIKNVEDNDDSNFKIIKILNIDTDNVNKTMLKTGDLVNTNNFSSAFFIIDNIHSMQLGSNSEMKVLESTKLHPISVQLFSGLAFFDISNSDDLLIIHTDYGYFKTNGGQFIIQLYKDSCDLLVFEGSVEFNSKFEESLMFSCKKNMAITITSVGVKSLDKFINIKAIDSNIKNQYNFNVNSAKKYYLDSNNKLKIVFHWLDAFRYPLSIDKITGNVNDKLSKYSVKFNKLNDVLVSMNTIISNYNIKVEILYRKCKQLEKRLNFNKKDADIILNNQKELDSFYVELSHINNTISYLDTNSFNNIQHNDFNYYLKHLYSKENEYWLLEIKKLHEYELELSTLTTVKQSLTELIDNHKLSKYKIEDDIIILSRKLTVIIDKIDHLNKSKINIEKLNEQIIKLSKHFNSNCITIESQNNDISIITNLKMEIERNINVLEELIKLNNDTLTQTKLKQKEQNILDSAIVADEKQLSNYNISLSNLDATFNELTNKKIINDKNISDINIIIKSLTDGLNNSIEVRANTLNEISKINVLLKDLNNRLELCNNDLTKFINSNEKHNSTLKIQEKAISTLTTQINDSLEKISEYEDKINKNDSLIKNNLIRIKENDNGIKKHNNEVVKSKIIIEDLKSMLIKTSSQKEDFVSKIKEANDKIEFYNNKLSKTEIDIDKLNNEINQIEKDNVVLSDESTKSHLKVATMQNNLSDSEYKYNELEKEQHLINDRLVKSDEIILNSELSFSEASFNFIRLYFTNTIISNEAINELLILYNHLNTISKEREKYVELNISISKARALCLKHQHEIKDSIIKLNLIINSIEFDYNKNTTTLLELKKESENKLFSINKIKSQIITFQDNIKNFEKETKSLDFSNIELEKKLLEAKTKLENYNNKIAVFNETSLLLINENGNYENENIEISYKINILMQNNIALNTKLKILKDLNIKLLNSIKQNDIDIENTNKYKLELHNKIIIINKNRNFYLDKMEKEKKIIYINQNELSKNKNKILEIENNSKPLIDRLLVLQNDINKIQIQINHSENNVKFNINKLSELKKSISELNLIISNRSKQISKYKPLLELKEQLNIKTNDLETKQKVLENIVTENNKITKQIELNTKNIEIEIKLISEESFLNDEKSLLQNNINKNKNELIKINKEINSISIKLFNLNKEIIDAKNMVSKINDYKNNSTFWSNYYRDIIINETAFQLNAFKNENLTKQIETLELNVGEQVYFNKTEQIRNTKAYLDIVTENYKKESINYWFVSQLLNDMLNSSSNSIKNSIDLLITKTADELLPLLFNYVNFEISDEMKFKIITNALQMYPEYLKLSDSEMLFGNVDRIDKSWRIKLLKLFENNKLLDLLDFLEPNMLITNVND